MPGEGERGSPFKACRRKRRFLERGRRVAQAPSIIPTSGRLSYRFVRASAPCSGKTMSSGVIGAIPAAKSGRPAWRARPGDRLIIHPQQLAEPGRWVERRRRPACPAAVTARAEGNVAGAVTRVSWVGQRGVMAPSGRKIASCCLPRECREVSPSLSRRLRKTKKKKETFHGGRSGERLGPGESLPNTFRKEGRRSSRAAPPASEHPVHSLVAGEERKKALQSPARVFEASGSTARGAVRPSPPGKGVENTRIAARG